MVHLTLGCATRPFASLPLAEACQRIAAAGYRDVALFASQGRVPVRGDSTSEQVRAVRQTVQDAGLHPSMLLARTNLDLGLDAAIADYRRLIANAAALGARWLLELGIGQPEQYDDYITLLRTVSPDAARAGIGISMKPHGGVTLTVDDLIRICHEVDHPAFGISYDPGNIIYYTEGERRPEPDAARVAPLVTTAIIKDCIVRDDTPDVMITPGEGWVDFRAVLGGLVSGDFAGPLYLETVGGKTVEEIDANVRRTRPFVLDILATL